MASTPTPGPRINLTGVSRILIAIWFLIWGGMTVLHLTFESINVVMGVLAIVIGVFILLGW